MKKKKDTKGLHRTPLHHVDSQMEGRERNSAYLVKGLKGISHVDLTCGGDRKKGHLPFPCHRLDDLFTKQWLVKKKKLESLEIEI